MRISEIANVAEYRMGEQSQNNCQFSEFWVFQIEKIMKIC